MEMKYADALRVRNRRWILLKLAEAGGVASFSTLQRGTGIPQSTLKHHLDVLVSMGMVENPVRGTYSLVYKTPWCYIVSSNVPYAYLGLLGRRVGRELSETETAVKLLRREGIAPRKLVVLTSYDAVRDWEDVRAEWILVAEDEIINVDAVREKAEPVLQDMMRDYIPIVDCTSATKPATIAYYQLASEYLTPLIYIYEEAEKLIWLISRDRLVERLGLSELQAPT